jgi:hypothetical protein
MVDVRVCDAGALTPRRGLLLIPRNGPATPPPNCRGGVVVDQSPSRGIEVHLPQGFLGEVRA